MISAENSIVIDASPQQVWSILADLEHWPDWNSWFTHMQIHGTSKQLQTGAAITFTNRIGSEGGSGTYDGRITRWVPGEGFTWVSGPSRWFEWAIYGEHWFRVQAEEEGTDGVLRTRMVQGENIGGFVSFALPGSMRQTLVDAFGSFNMELKKKVEGEVR